MHAQRRLRVAHVTLGLEVGGQEKLLVEFARLVDRARFDQHVITLSGRGQLAYTLDGKLGLDEQEFMDVPGFRDSRPVRVGNEAAAQHQLDVYGWVVDAAWALARSGTPLHRGMWRAVEGFADFVCRTWREPDAGIWEMRGDAAHYVHSKLMGWLALDRAMRMSSSSRTKRSRTETWRRER